MTSRDPERRGRGVKQAPASGAGLSVCESDRLFRTLAESTSTAIFVCRGDRVLYVNPAGEEITGYSAAELLGEPWDLFVPAEVRPGLRERAAARLRGEPTPERYETRILTKDGRERWVDVTAAVILLDDGEPAALATAVDVTERKQAEVALRESSARLELGEERLRAIVEGTSSATGADFLRSLVRHLGEALGMEYAFVSEIADEAMTRMRLLALWQKDGYHEPFEYDLRGTPCEQVVGRQLSYLPTNVWRLFPDDRWIVDTRIESYIAVPLFDRGGRPLGHMAVLSTQPLSGDVPALAILKIFAARAAAEIERKLAEEALAKEKELAQVTLASIGDGVIRTDAAGVIDYLNPVAEKLTGWSAADACGQPVTRVFNVIDETTGRPLPNAVERCLAEGRVIEHAGYSMLVQRDGRESAIRDSVAPIQDHQGRITGSVLVFKDVTQLRGMEREMIYLARHDPLTGLINRREFEKRLQHCLDTAWEDSREHALFYLDLDEFKVVNDTCGHLAGDELLKQVTSLLRSMMRKTDTLARLGGDEFGVLLEDATLDVARELGERLRVAVRQYRFGWQERIFEIGVSIGLVPITAASGDMARVLSAADAACYVAKEGGRNRMHEYQPDDSALAERYGEMQWIHRIHKAFAEHRFCLYRQSIHPLHGDGTEPPLCELFIRMLDEEGRVATPAAFIPAAERYHLIASIDRWVLHAAFVALACGTLSHGDTTRFAINLSGQSLGDESFLDYVLAEIEATGIAPERIFFEITETAAVGNLAKAMHFIRVLKERGFRFVLDDFGSGLSSFAYLKNLQVDFLKIDGAFVRDMVGNSVQRALVESIHQIGQVMGIRTIAESVEDRTTLEALREIGVDYGQGYGLSMPEPLI
jgi:diguanylate cyclase (GGDEF)-like protein/PAS domain S-box-containing protein